MDDLQPGINSQPHGINWLFGMPSLDTLEFRRKDWSSHKTQAGEHTVQLYLSLERPRYERLRIQFGLELLDNPSFEVKLFYRGVIGVPEKHNEGCDLEEAFKRIIPEALSSVFVPFIRQTIADLNIRSGATAFLLAPLRPEQLPAYSDLDIPVYKPAGGEASNQAGSDSP